MRLELKQKGERDVPSPSLWHADTLKTFQKPNLTKPRNLVQFIENVRKMSGLGKKKQTTYETWWTLPHNLFQDGHPFFSRKKLSASFMAVFPTKTPKCCISSPDGYLTKEITWLLLGSPHWLPLKSRIVFNSLNSKVLIGPAPYDLEELRAIQWQYTVLRIWVYCWVPNF